MRASDFIVAVDDGHGHGSRTVGQFDPGAVGNGRREADVTQVIGDKMRAEFRRRGCKTFKPIGLYTTRARQADTNGAHVLISNHLNAAAATAHGTETFVHPTASARSRSLAARVNTAIVRRLGTRDRGVKSNGFAVLSGKSPSVLIEWVFITNKADLDKLDANMDRAIVDVVDAVLAEFKVQSTAPVAPAPNPAPRPTLAENVVDTLCIMSSARKDEFIRLMKEIGQHSTQIPGDAGRVKFLVNHRVSLTDPVASAVISCGGTVLNVSPGRFGDTTRREVVPASGKFIGNVR